MKILLQRGFSRRIFLIFLSVLLLIIFIIAGFFLFHHDKISPIKTVRVQGDFQRIDKKQLRQLIVPLAQTNFFRVNLQKIQSKVQQLSWVAHAEVRRIWPGKITIDIASEIPIARWNRDQLLNAYGEIFQMSLAKTTLNQLPLFEGRKDRAVEMAGYYQQMSEILKPLNLKIVKMKLNLGGFWSVTLDNGMQLQLGNDQILTRLSRFVDVYPKVFAHATRRAKKVNLQYQYGMAVQW